MASGAWTGADEVLERRECESRRHWPVADSGSDAEGVPEELTCWCGLVSYRPVHLEAVPDVA